MRTAVLVIYDGRVGGWLRAPCCTTDAGPWVAATQMPATWAAPLQHKRANAHTPVHLKRVRWPAPGLRLLSLKVNVPEEPEAPDAGGGVVLAPLVVVGEGLVRNLDLLEGGRCIRLHVQTKEECMQEKQAEKCCRAQAARLQADCVRKANSLRGL